MAVYMINIWKSTIFLYTSNEQRESVGKRTHHHLPLHQKQKKKKEKKYLGINLTKSVQDLSGKRHKTLMTEVKEDKDEWRSRPYSWIGRSAVVKRSNSLTPDVQMQFNTNQILQNIWSFQNFKVMKNREKARNDYRLRET